MTAHPTGPPDNQLTAALRDLCQWIEQIATAWQDPEELVRMLDLSAHVLLLAEDHRLAARYWTQALEINRAHPGQHSRTTEVRASILESLSRLYHHTQRPLRAIDVERELVALHQAAEQTLGSAHDLARALAQLGATLIITDRFDEGRDYLMRADDAFRAFGAPTPRMVRTHVCVLKQLASVHRHHQPAEARRCETRAIEVAALPLVPITPVIVELNTTLTTAIDQLTALAQQVTGVVDAIGEGGQPHPAGLAAVPDLIATWYDLANSVGDVGFRLRNHVHSIASAAGDPIADPRQRPCWTSWPSSPNGPPMLPAPGTSGHRSSSFVSALPASSTEPRTSAAPSCSGPGRLNKPTMSPPLPRTRLSPPRPAPRQSESWKTRADLCRAQNRLGDAIDIETQLLDRHRYADNQPAIARALARLGATLIANDHFDGGRDYLTEAHATFQALGPGDPLIASDHAEALELLATALDQLGHSAEANQYRRQAVALRTPSPSPAGQP